MMKSKLISILLPLIFGFMLLFGSPLKAELFSVSAGIPLSHDIKDENLDSDGVSGFFFHVKFPILVGVGLESYETKIKDLDTKIGTTMYDIFLSAADSGDQSDRWPGCRSVRIKVFNLLIFL